MPSSSQATTESSWIQTIRPSRAIIRYSIWIGSNAAWAFAKALSTRSRSSGWSTLPKSSGSAAHSSGGHPFSASIWGLTYDALAAPNSSM